MENKLKTMCEVLQAQRNFFADKWAEVSTQLADLIVEHNELLAQAAELEAAQRIDTGPLDPLE